MSAAEWAQSVPLYACLGFGFGFAFEKSDVTAPFSIRGQFTFSHWAMFKMFFAAVSGSSFSWVLAKKLAPYRFAEVHKCLTTGECGGVSQHMRGALVGAGLLGAGMAIAGACPGMVTVQVRFCFLSSSHIFYFVHELRSFFCSTCFCLTLNKKQNSWGLVFLQLSTRFVEGLLVRYCTEFSTLSSPRG